ncbi:MAG: aminotransferase class IV family protein [Bacteroidetes bacterium]|nr:aminotransferase class IV family protein [Bacteroidota bacterium]
MSPLYETIAIVNGIPRYLIWHEQRMNRALMEVWNNNLPSSLSEYITVPPEFSKGLVRCNIYYGPSIGSVTFKQYVKRRIQSLKLVVCDSIDYHVKYADRDRLESLLSMRGDCDEILIVKNGLITDTSMSNVIFCGNATWYTPAKPLLAGTTRDRLLAEGQIVEKDISVEELFRYSGCKLINAMRDPDQEEMIPISEIRS